eukprot:139102-Chlamydomonas_euryale.AAC.8
MALCIWQPERLQGPCAVQRGGDTHTGGARKVGCVSGCLGRQECISLFATIVTCRQRIWKWSHPVSQCSSISVSNSNINRNSNRNSNSSLQTNHTLARCLSARLSGTERNGAQRCAA